MRATGHPGPQRTLGVVLYRLRIAADMTLRDLLRRRLAIVILIVLPVAFYFASHDAVGRSIRSLLFGVSWAVSTVSFFATLAAREIRPRLVLAGWSARLLDAGRTLGLLALAGVVGALFWALVAADQPVRSLAWVAGGFIVTAVVAVAVGTTVGLTIGTELEGTLVLFFVAGLQAVINPFSTLAKFLPFWSSRELGTLAVDGPQQASGVAGLAHGFVVVLVCLVVSKLATAQRQP